MRTATLLVLLGHVFFTSVLSADEADKANQAILTLDRIYGKSEFSAKGFSGKWIGDGHEYVQLEPTEAGSSANGIVIYDAATGERNVLVESSLLVPDGLSKPLTIAGYSISEDRSLVLISTNTKRVWRQNTRGDYWVLDRSARQLKKLGGDWPASHLMFAKFSPSGDQVAYVYKQNVYVESLLSGEIRALTQSGNDYIISGTSDWVNEEELSIRDGFRWNADGSKIAFWQFDTTGVQRMTMIDNTSARYPKVIEFPYPKTGQVNSACRVGVVAVDGGQITWMRLPGDPREHYIARVRWAPKSETNEDEDQLVLQQLNRLQNTNRLYVCNSRNGASTEVLVEQDDAWVDVHDEMFWSLDGHSFTWISERGGWRQAFAGFMSGRQPRCITNGAYDVIEVLGMDEAADQLYFVASPENPTQRYLFSVHLDGSEMKRLSPKNQAGTHSYSLSRDAKFAVHTFSSANSPPQVQIVSLPDHECVRTLESNDKLSEKVKKLKHKEVEFFRVTTDDGTEVDGWSILPPKMKPEKKYPLLVYVYGEPAGSTVRDRWGGTSYLWHQMLAQQGYVVMSFDNRGTPAPRGREWRKSVYRKIGINTPKDQAGAVRKVIEERNYIDPDRVGIWGWSGGGSSTLNAMFQFPDVFKTGISVAPVPNQRYYDTIYQERYMGLPGDNAEGYKAGSPITHAHRLQGNLLIIHGTGDDNCHYATTEMLVNELIKHNKRFDMMSYPNRTHSISEGKNTTLHLRSLMTRYLNDNLPSGPR